jgi:hypothetical protein
MSDDFIDVLIFNKKPKLKIGDKINEILANNGYYKYSKEVYIYKIKKEKNQYFVYIKSKNLIQI